ncbi:hypothetical protein COR50_14125 [Chitinophaga caeni]|uniref:Bacterial toxin 44 domain-containing protein n=2 Tax=Chitinophaga caeni TaxID=2029983 RepID=A0A291QW63_9BACT|nr:hypothetical protein COR50_14125 [Chitinophaga caeni]
MTVAYYDVDLLSAVDYYPFGMQMPGRVFNGGGYRYGFNGKEQDNEVKGWGNQQDYGMRIYDTRMGRFLSVDPLTRKFPWYSPYQFAGNTPIQAIDLDGAEPLYVNFANGIKVGNPKITKSSQWLVYSYINNGLSGSHTTYVTDPKTFSSAAQFNTVNLNTQFYSSFGQKEEYYKWAQSQMNDKKVNTQWFSMDAKIVGPFEVGLTELDPGVMLSKDTKGFLNNIGSLVLKENMGVYNQLNSIGSFNSKTGGMALDRELLYNEQSKIQDFMYSLDVKDLDKYLREYNAGFKVFQAIKGKDHYLNVASSVIGGDIDFGSIKHRMVIGQVLMYQMHGQKIDDKAKQTIMNNATEDTGRYYKERYGNDD